MKTQAWGWLVAGVLAAGFNASYHDGGMEWAHRIADQVEHNTGAVMALATGRADQFLAEARVLTVRQEASRCPLQNALAQVQSAINSSDIDFASDMDFAPVDRIEVMTAREQAQMARLEANRARIEARVANIRIPAVALTPVVVSTPKVVCPRVRVNIPRLPQIKLPVIHIENPGAGPV
jgi:hypothetical protein